MLNPEERDALAKKHMRTAYWFAHRFRLRFPQLEFEEVQGLALFGLAQAIDRFDPELGYAFSTYLGSVIFGLLRRATRKPRVKTLSIETPIAEDMTLNDVLFDQTDYEALALDRLARAEFMACCPPLYRQILSAWADGMTQSEIGKAVGISQVHVSRIIARIRKQITIQTAERSRAHEKQIERSK